jgi:hypothetical protein
MIFLAQIDPARQVLSQGLGFSDDTQAQAHMAAHPEFDYFPVDAFVSPSTHTYDAASGRVIPKTA